MTRQVARTCQVVHTGLHQLTCEDRESGGLRCEYVGPDADHAHFVGEHSIQHQRWGNGWACSAIDRMVADQVPYVMRAEVVSSLL